ncbi:PTM, partial [Symbiodinium microadriaticum]
VIFEDGAEEEMNSEELDRCACAPDAVPPTSLKFLRTLLVARAEAANGGREGSGDEAVVSMESTIALTPTSLPNSRGGGSSKKKMRKLSSSADDKKKRERKPAAIIKSPVGGAHGSGKKKSQRGKKGALCGLYITKYFEGFGNFCGLISSFDPPFYKVIYEDGDEEEVSPEDLADMLVDKTAVSDDTRAKLDAWEYTYTYAPVPAEDIPVVARTVPAKYIDLTPRELVQVEIYRRYIGRIFLDKDTG